MTELGALLLLAGLFIVFGTFYRGRGGCEGCPGLGRCDRPAGCAQRSEDSER